MAYDIFMEIQGIKGDSTDVAHKDCIEVVSYRHRVSQPYGGAVRGSGDYSGAHSSHEDFTVVKRLDKSSPILLQYCCEARPIQMVKLELCRAMGDKTPFMKYTLKKVIVSSISPDGAAKADDVLPWETVTFRYSRIEVAYTETDPRQGGKVGGVVQYTYDVGEGKAM